MANPYQGVKISLNSKIKHISTFTTGSGTCKGHIMMLKPRPQIDLRHQKFYNQRSTDPSRKINHHNTRHGLPPVTLPIANKLWREIDILGQHFNKNNKNTIKVELDYTRLQCLCTQPITCN